MTTLLSCSEFTFGGNRLTGNEKELRVVRQFIADRRHLASHAVIAHGQDEVSEPLPQAIPVK